MNRSRKKTLFRYWAGRFCIFGQRKIDGCECDIFQFSRNQVKIFNVTYFRVHTLYQRKHSAHGLFTTSDDLSNMVVQFVQWNCFIEDWQQCGKALGYVSVWQRGKKAVVRPESEWQKNPCTCFDSQNLTRISRGRFFRLAHFASHETKDDLMRQ